MTSDEAKARGLRPPGEIESIGSLIPQDREQHFKLFTVFRDYVKHEDDLINNRLNWNFTIQGFLFAAYSFCLEKIADIRLGLLSTNINLQRIGQLRILHSLFE